MGIEFRLLSENGTETAIPDLESFSLSPVFCDAGAVEFQYPADGVNFTQLKAEDEVRIAVYVDGVREPRLDAILQDIDGDDIKEAAVWKFTGFFNIGRLKEGRIYPKGWPTVDPLDTKYVLSSVSAGTIMRTFLSAAQARGTLTDITFSSFTATTDSNGLQWDRIISKEYTPGTDLLTVIKELYADGVCEFEMVGTDLRMYRPGTFGEDLTTTTPPVVFRKGRDLSDSPRKSSTRGVATAMLAAGADGLYHEEVNAGAVATRRRIEGTVSGGQIKDAATLDAFTEAQLERAISPKMEKSHGLKFAEPDTPRPIRDFNLGDWAWSDVGKGLEKLQIKQWTLKYAANGELSGSLVLNDLIDAQDAVLAKRIDGIVAGSTLTGASEAVERVPGELVDAIGPSTPTGLGLTSAAYLTTDGQTYATVTGTWPQVTTNSDGTIIEDLAGYTLRWAYESNPTGWQLVDSDGDETVARFSGVMPGAAIRAQVRAYDRGGWPSGWSTPVTFHTTASDSTIPDKPSTIVAEAIPGGLLRGTFDGKTSTGGAWAADVNQWKIHSGTTSNFIPVASNHVDTLTGPGSVYLDPGYGQSRYFKVVAVDRLGNHGPASDPSINVTTTKLLGDDIFDGAIGSLQLADAAITNAKIASLAVNDAKIGAVSAAKITAGVVFAEITIAGRIATALSGRRAEMNGIGFQGWDAAGNLTISLDGENNVLMGIFRTSLTGRRIEIGAAGNSGEIKFIGPDGRLGRIRGFTASLGDIGDEAMEMGIPIANTWGGWNSFQVNLDEEIFMESGFTVLTGGGNGPGQKGLQLRYANNRGTPTAAVTSWVRMNITGSQTHINSPAGATRVLVDDGGVTLYPNGNGSLEVTGGPNADESAHLLFQNEGGTRSGRLKFCYYADTYGSRFEFRNPADSGFFNVLGATFYNQSDERTKENIRELDRPARELMKKARGKFFTFKHEGGEDTDAPVRFGVMAQDLPKDLSMPTEDGTLMVSPLAVASMAVNMIHEIEEELAQVRSELAELKGAKK